MYKNVKNKYKSVKTKSQYIYNNIQDIDKTFCHTS